MKLFLSTFCLILAGIYLGAIIYGNYEKKVKIFYIIASIILVVSSAFFYKAYETDEKCKISSYVRNSENERYIYNIDTINVSTDTTFALKQR